MVRTASSSRPWALSVLAASVALMAAWPAAATPLASAGASFGDLRFRLIDLDPNDGIAPGVTFQGGGFADLEVLDPATGQLTIVNGLQTDFNGLNFGTQTYGNDTSSLVWNGPALTAQATLTTSGIAQRLENNTYRYDGYYGATTTTNDSVNLTSVGQVGSHPLLGASEDAPTYTLTLAANTGIVIEGTASSFLQASAQGQADLQAGWLASTGYEAPEYFLNSNLSGDVMVNAFLFTASTDSPDSFNGLEVHGSALTWYDNLNVGWASCSTCEGDLPGSDVTQSRSRAFALDFFNYSGQSKDVSLVLQARAGLNGYMSFNASVPLPTGPDPEIPPIPEPGTYALMGLGLVGLWGATRAQRRRIAG